MSGGFFRGTSADQDTRFSNKQAKLMKSQKFPAELEHLVDMSKVKMDVMRPWIANRVTELLGFEDEVLINFIYGLLDGKVINGKEVQISLTGFMEKNTGKFMKELWTLLLSAQTNASGVPQQFLDAKEEETRKKKVETDRIASEIQKKKDKEKEDRELEKERLRKMDGKADSSRENNVTSEPNSKHQPRSSIVHGENEKDANGRNSSRMRNRVSSSPHSADHSSLSPRNRRSRSKSISNSRSYSGGRRRSKSPSESPQPRRRSVSSRSVSHSPRKRSLSPRRRPSPRRYISPSRNRYVRRRSRSPIRRGLRSPFKRRSRTPIRRRSRSPIRRRSRSSVSRSPVRRRSRSPVPRSPVRRRSRSPVSRSPIRRRSPSPVRRRSPISVRRRSPSPMRRRRSPSPVRRRYRRSPFSPRRRSPSPTRRSPILSRRRSPISRRHRSPSPEEWSSPSPVRRLPPSPGRRYSPLRPRSPVLSPRERIRPHEKRSPVRHARRREDDGNSDESPKGAESLLHQPPTSMRSPQRDPRDQGDISKRTSSSSPSPHRSPSHSQSPPASRRRSPSNDRRSYSPLVNRQTKGLKSQDVIASSPGKSRDQKLHRDSSKVSEQEKLTHYDRDNRDQKRKPSGKRSEYSSAAYESKDLLVSDKDAYPPGRVDGKTSIELLSGHDGEIRIKDQELRREKIYGKVSEVSDQQELQTIQKVSSVGERERVYPEKAYIDDERTRSRSNEGKGRKRLLETESTLKSNEKDEKKDKSGSLSSSSLESDKHRPDGHEKRKHKRSKRREEASMDSYDSEIDDRKDAKKRKEEKRLRKEERRRRREERRRRREERRADKLKTKSMDKNSPSSDYEMHRDGNASEGERNAKMLSGASSDAEAESEQKKLEIELRKKALESLKAKKGISR